MKADFHIHTTYSPDSVADMNDYIKRAMELGYGEICFTDHIDYGTSSCFSCDCINYYKDIINYRKIYRDKINIRLGMEFGAQAHHSAYFQKIFDLYPFDFIILSFHLVEDKDLWDRSFQRGKTQKEFNLRYYEEISKTIDVYQDFSVLGHLDLIRRYDDFGEMPFCENKEIIEEILLKVIQNGKGIELNTSSFRYGLSDLMPSRDILKFYKQLGGEIITIGSDCHRVSDFGYKIDDMRELLKTLGYKYFSTFEKMEAKFHLL